MKDGGECEVRSCGESVPLCVSAHVYDDLIVNNMINISCPRCICTFQPGRVISETRVLGDQEGGGEVNTASCYIHTRCPRACAQCIKLQTVNVQAGHRRNAPESKVKRFFSFKLLLLC